MSTNYSILILGSFDKGAIENQYKKHLIELGNIVSCFDIQRPVSDKKNKSLIDKAFFKIHPNFYYEPLNKELLLFMEKKKFDVILVFKGMELFVESLQVLKTHTKLLINYNPDHPLDIFSSGAGNVNIINNLSYYDFHISYAKNISLRLKKEKNLDCYTIPFGYDIDIVNKLTDSATEKHFNYFTFIGAYDADRASNLTKLQYPHLKIYGDKAWSNRNLFNQYIRHHYQYRSLYEEEYYQAISCSLGVLNFLRKQNLIENSHNMRTFEVPAVGGVLLAERTIEQQEFFEEDKEAIYFDSLDELKDKMLFLEQNETLVRNIKQAAYQRAIRSGYSYKYRTAELLKIVNNYI